MQYKTSFVLAVIGTFAANIVEFGAVLVLFGRIPHLAGWSLGEVALLWGMSAISFAMADMIATGFDVLPDQHPPGDVRSRADPAPWGLLPDPGRDHHVAPRRAHRAGRGRLRAGQSQLALTWTPDRVAMLALALACGAAIFFAIFVCGAAYSFWTVRGPGGDEHLHLRRDDDGQLPPGHLRGLAAPAVTFILPLAFVNYYPALYILGRPDPLGLPAGVAWLAPRGRLACAAPPPGWPGRPACAATRAPAHDRDGPAQATAPSTGAGLVPPAMSVEGLRKTFRVARHRRGALAAVRNLFDRTLP